MTRAVLLAIFAALPWSACAAPPHTESVAANTAPTHDEVVTLLATQAAAWNRGDLEAFVAAYWQDPALTFVGAGGVTRGHRPLLAVYRAAYPDAAARGELTFEVLEVRPLGTTHALVIGRYALARERPDAGIFTLIVERAGELRIVHAHTTASR